MKYITIEGFEALTEQQVFDMSVKHVLRNGKQSMTDGRCTYTGIGCAAAPFLQESARSMADVADDGYSAGWDHLVKLEVVPHRHSGLVVDLQCCHDEVGREFDFITEFKNSAQAIADLRGLDASVLDT